MFYLLHMPFSECVLALLDRWTGWHEDNNMHIAEAHAALIPIPVLFGQRMHGTRLPFATMSRANRNDGSNPQGFMEV